MFCHTILLRGSRFFPAILGRVDATVGNPSSSSNFSIRAFRAQTSQFELFELILLLKLDKRFPVEQFEPRVSQSTVPFPLLTGLSLESPKQRKIKLNR